MACSFISCDSRSIVPSRYFNHLIYVLKLKNTFSVFIFDNGKLSTRFYNGMTSTLL